MQGGPCRPERARHAREGGGLAGGHGSHHELSVNAATAAAMKVVHVRLVSQYDETSSSEKRMPPTCTNHARTTHKRPGVIISTGLRRRHGCSFVVQFRIFNKALLKNLN